ncbi:MAG TPA: glycosyltransferase [Gaiellaceae bacterium]|nr:glycosyltransferase [Gaiellaceae bacterium]
MRILHVIQELGTGGAERILVSAYRGAREAGHEVYVAAAPGPLAAELDTEPYPLPMVQRRPWRVPEATAAVRRAVRSSDPDVIHAHNPVVAAAAGLATRRGRRPPGLVSLHGSSENEWRGTVALVRLSGLAPVACGPGVAAALEAHGCVPVATVPNAVGPAPPPADRGELEREWGLAPGTRLVLAVGRLVEQKNHALAIEALAEVPDATLVIVGDGPFRPSLEQAAAQAKVPGRVVFAGSRPDARALMGAADAVVLPSRWEGLPLTALEALASGTPLVATDVQGIRELVVDGQDALLVPQEPEALAAALRRVLDDPDLATRLADAGRRVEGAGSDEKLVAGFLRLYEGLR